MPQIQLNATAHQDNHLVLHKTNAYAQLPHKHTIMLVRNVFALKELHLKFSKQAQIDVNAQLISNMILMIIQNAFQLENSLRDLFTTIWICSKVFQPELTTSKDQPNFRYSVFHHLIDFLTNRILRTRSELKSLATQERLPSHHQMSIQDNHRQTQVQRRHGHLPLNMMRSTPRNALVVKYQMPVEL